MEQMVSIMTCSSPAAAGVDIVLLLLVIALGHVTYEGSSGAPIESFTRRAFGLRGGDVLISPGSTCFDQALQQWSLISDSPSSLKKAQAFLLQATYYETSARHRDFLRFAVAASAVCRTLVDSRLVMWCSMEGGMLKRAYRSSVLDEGYYHYELDLPETGIFFLQDQVPLPSFTNDFDSTVGVGVQTGERPLAYLQFLASISLKKIFDHIHHFVRESKFLSTWLQSVLTNDTAGVPSYAPDIASEDDIPVSPSAVPKELRRQLESSREALPRDLQWSDDCNDQSTPMPRDGDAGIGAAVITAQLRCRFYYTSFALELPYPYIALHHPALISLELRQHCVSALRSALRWPLSMTLLSDEKRLISHHFTWTQSAITLLCIYVMIQSGQTLGHLCRENLDLRELKMGIPVQLCWLQDMKAVDGIAEWVWKLFYPCLLNGCHTTTL